MAQPGPGRKVLPFPLLPIRTERRIWLFFFCRISLPLLSNGLRELVVLNLFGTSEWALPRQDQLLWEEECAVRKVLVGMFLFLFSEVRFLAGFLGRRYLRVGKFFLASGEGGVSRDSIAPKSPRSFMLLYPADPFFFSPLLVRSR